MVRPTALLRRPTLARRVPDCRPLFVPDVLGLLSYTSERSHARRLSRTRAQGGPVRRSAGTQRPEGAAPGAAPAWIYDGTAAPATEHGARPPPPPPPPPPRALPQFV
eukprot:COSAG01_NODE_2856_length_6964_cov_15.382957_4_plen_107_part_00